MSERVVTCPCGTRLRVRDDLVNLQCPSCRRRLKMKSAPGAIGETTNTSNSELSSTWTPHVRNPEQPVKQKPASPKRKRKRKKHSKYTSLFLYPWLYPTILVWIGLSLIMTLTNVMIAVTGFIMGIIVAFMAIGSVFVIAAGGVGILALTSYICAVFISCITQTFCGENSMSSWPPFSWLEMLGPFAQCLGALVCSSGLAYVVTYPLSNSVEIDWMFLGPEFNPLRLFLLLAIVFHAFPILLLSNMAEGSWIPLGSLLETIKRLAMHPVQLIAFFGFCYAGLLILAPFGFALSFAHPMVGIVADGPISAAGLLYYGHWLGRLGKAISDE